MKIITWNVKRGGKPGPQVKKLTSKRPDLIGLQEIKRTTAEDWKARLTDAGFAVETTADLIGEQSYGVLIASRWPIERMPTKWVEVPYAARLLSVLVKPPDALAFELHNTH